MQSVLFDSGLGLGLTVLYKTKLLDGTEPNTNPKTNSNRQYPT